MVRLSIWPSRWFSVLGKQWWPDWSEECSQSLERQWPLDTPLQWNQKKSLTVLGWFRDHVWKWSIFFNNCIISTSRRSLNTRLICLRPSHLGFDFFEEFGCWSWNKGLSQNPSIRQPCGLSCGISKLPKQHCISLVAAIVPRGMLS